MVTLQDLKWIVKQPDKEEKAPTARHLLGHGKRVVSMENEKINHPAHYCQGGIECIDAIEAATTNLTGIEAVCTANVIKYIWRWKEKNGAEDLRKAEWYLKRLAQIVENKETFKKPGVIVNVATGEYCVE